MSEPVLRVENVTRTYRVGDVDVHALRGVSLTVERGEFVAIMGSSGSGKSTLMAVLGCLDRPTSGSYRFEGVDVSRLGEPALASIRSERLGFVFQSFNLLARTSAIENVALPLFYSTSGPSGRSARLERARDSLKLLGLGDRERNTPGQLSGGQQQRVAIARALINAPGVLLADEPTGNLDTRTSHEIMETLQRLNREQGVTIIVVTHESDIAAYADRTVTMRDGQIVSDERRPRPPGPLPEVKPESAGMAVFHPHAASPRAAATGPVWAFTLMVLGSAMQAIALNKMRSALTMLGVFIGVAALIAMVAVGNGANAAVRKQIESLGTNLAVVLPGAVLTGGARAGFGSASTLTVADAQAIRREATTVALVAYMRQMGQVEIGNQNWTTNIQAVSVNYPPVTNWTIESGRGVSQEDEKSAALIVVIGRTVQKQLFSQGENPIGATILIKGFPLRVVGVLTAKGQSMWGQDQDDLVMIP
ncbi:MAG: ABC transporter permease, partial [Xanthobacteraceae bacterium]